MRIGNLQGTGLLKFLFFCGFSCLLLSLNFYTNFLHSAEQNWFASFDRDSESGIFGRIIKSRQDGIFSSGGLPVWGITEDPSVQQAENRNAFLNNTTFKEFSPHYCSQICGQGIVFSVLDKIIPCSSSVKLRIFRALSSVLTAFVVTAVMAWFYIEFGLFAGLTVLAFACISQWLTVFARNLWWSTWAFYLPMAAVMLCFLRTGENRGAQPVKLGRVVFFSMLIKTIFNGYEYITTTLIMMVVPFVYYSVLGKVRFAACINGLIKIAMSAGLAIAVSLCILSVQIAAASGNFSDGFKHFSSTLQRRTHAPSGAFPSVYSESLRAGTLPVVYAYFKGAYCYFDLPALKTHASESYSRINIWYAALILFFGAMTIAVYLAASRCATTRDDCRISALILASWFSILAPLSWFVIFKAHSAIHENLNFIVWQMPFTFFGAAITGLAVKKVFFRVVAALRCSSVRR